MLNTRAGGGVDGVDGAILCVVALLLLLPALILQRGWTPIIPHGVIQITPIQDGSSSPKHIQEFMKQDLLLLIKHPIMEIKRF